ncbi:MULTISPECIES: hypothetical protein [Streptomyces]|jgi:hypothetical protein|uniref:Uncharacterized protein n=1 Tax=Streptomyces nymphaeiformis TaxID=2663842 RepID=A0A7W7XDU5_9ACTN|nr:hypothetical protein [Streptomyces nymphaeiformis]MBB4983836.1 hypothetical protein [Streptomyces nymphaeiformis]
MRKTLLILGLVLAAAFGISYLVLRDDQPPSPPGGGKPPGAPALPYKPGGPLPAQAADAAQDLASSDAATQRAALTPELDQALAAGRLLPEGTRIDLSDDSWHEDNGYANAQATLTKPGKPAQHVLIGFAKRSAGWRITVVEVVK